MNKAILSLTVAEILDRYRRRALSPADVAEACLAQMRTLNPSLNAFALQADADDVLRQARESEARWAKGAPCGALDGIPTTIKDGADVKGWPTRDGSALTLTLPVAEDAPFVANLRHAGAIFLGKTTTPEFGHKGVTDSPAFGITRNPWDPAKTSGGSSGGAGVAAATRMGFLHQGSDGGGSIRIPASFCGVFGIKPTQGLLPSAGPTLFSKFAASGPLTRTAADAALMLGAMAGRDYALGKPQGLRIAYAATVNGTPVDPQVAALVRAAAFKCSALGTVEEITFDIPDLIETFNTHWGAIAAWLLDQFPAQAQARMDACLSDWGRRGSEIGIAAYQQAELARLQLIERMKGFFKNYDLLLLPSTAMTAFAAGQNSPLGADGKPWEDWTPLTFPANLGQLPAASLPCGLTGEGLPAGLQIVSGPLREDLILQTAHWLEGETGFRDWLDIHGEET